MSDAIGLSSTADIWDPRLYEVLKNCANQQSYDSLSDYNDVSAADYFDYHKMISTKAYSTSGNISTSSFASDDSFGDNILEENGRISLAYENLRTIPRRIAERFAAQTKCLDLSYNHFENLAFLTSFEELHTLILDRNYQLDVNTLPYLPSLKILWLNNCNIANVIEWTNRIQTHCPSLEHLSIMGNPGTSQRFNLCTLTAHSPTELSAPTTAAADYREYILQMLPNLEYLDGAARCGRSAPLNGYKAGSSSSSSRTPSSSSSNKLHGANHSQKPSPTLSFKDLFRLNKRRKKSYQSSSTN